MSETNEEKKTNSTTSQVTKEISKKDFDHSDYFISQEAFLIFVLLHVEGEKRVKLIGIKEKMYESLTSAKKWRNSIIQLIHPDRCQHPLADEAVSKVNDIYSRMKKNAQ